MTRPSAKRVFAIVVSAAAALNVLKGVPHYVHDMGFPYWTMTYDAGFIRRGLVGTLFHEFVAGFDPETQRRQLLGVHTALTFALWAAVLGLALHEARRAPSARARTIVLTATGALFLSHLPSTVLSLAGYLDVVLLVLLVACAYLADRGRYRLAGLVAAIGPVVHDAFLFLWLPVALIAARRVLRAPKDERRAAARRAAPLASPLLTCALTMAFHSPSAVRKMIEQAPVVDGVKESFRVYQYGLSPIGALVIMGRKYASIPEQVVYAAAFFLPAAVVVAVCASALDRDPVRWRRAAFAALVTVSPCAILLVAWDLSRFLLWTILAGLLLVLSNAKEQAERDERAVGPGPALALGALVLLSTGPHVYGYFEMAFSDYLFGPGIARVTPGAKLTYAFLHLYNRMQFVRHYAGDEKPDTCRIDAPGAEKVAPCAFVVREGQYAETPELWLGPGTFEATIRTSPLAPPATGDACTHAPVASITPHVIWRFGGFKPATRVDVTTPSSTTVRFVMTEEESGMGRARVRVWATTGCFRVDGLSVVQIDAR